VYKRQDTTGEPLAKSRVQLKTNLAGFNYELILPSGEIEAGRSATVRLKITQGDGQGFNQLEPLMGALAHLVGFFEDRQTVLHLHPKGLPILDPNERGGPELEFQIFSMKSGYVRLFAQVQIAGQSHFASFTIEIKPAGSFPPPPPVARQMSPFSLVERSGRQVTQEDLAGKIVIVHLMFTGCSFGTGGVMQRMAELQQRTASMPEVLLVSLTVDPLSDTPAVLTEFAQAHRADPDRWLFLTGGRTDIRRLVQTSFYPPPPDAVQRDQSDFVGLDTLTLVDPRGRILESFEGLNPDSVNQLVAQIEKLRQQKPDR
jgi:protein SCO1/2